MPLSLSLPATAIRTLFDGLVELVWPAHCPSCSDPVPGRQSFCSTCAISIEPIASPCPRCGLPLPNPSPGLSPPCLSCQRSPPPWSTLRSPLAFAGSLSVAVRRWKLHPEPALTAPLAELLAPSLSAFSQADAIVPVPLHPRRLRQREFNQAGSLARAARRLARSPLPVEELLDRAHDTPPQHHLPAGERRSNVRRAFVAPRPSRVRGRHLVLVDDVVTTGATVDACTRTLLRAGASRVDILALARTLP